MHIGGQKSQEVSARHKEEEEAPTGVHLKAALEAPQPAGPGMLGFRRCCQLQRYQKEISSTRTSSRFRDVQGKASECLKEIAWPLLGSALGI